MKKTILLSLIFLLSLLTISFFISGNALAQPKDSSSKIDVMERDVETGYLLDEDFSIYPQAGSGWEKYNLPHGSSIANVRSQNTSLETYIKKYFVNQEDEITVDISISVSMDVQNGYIVLFGNDAKGKEVKSVLINIEDNELKYVTNDGTKISLGMLSVDYTTGLTIKASAKNGTCDLYVDGKKTIETKNLSFNEMSLDLCAISFGIPKKASGGILLKKVRIVKGYDVFEDLTTTATVERRSVDYDFNKGANITTNCTVNDHSIQNDNNSLASKCYDDNDDTYWQHNTQYSITQNVYFMINYGEVVSLDYVRIKFYSYYKGAVSANYCAPSGAWAGFGDPKYILYETTNENEYVIEFRNPTPVAMTEIGIGFMIGTGSYNIASGEIKVSTIECKCLNPVENTQNTYPSDFIKNESDDAIVKTSSLSGDHAFEIIDNSSTEAASTEIAIDRNTNITLDYQVSYKDNKDGNLFGLYDENGNYIGIITKNGCLNLVESANGNLKYTPITNAENYLDKYPINIWLKISLKYDKETGTVTVSYNGWEPIGAIKVNDIFKNSTWKKFKVTSSIDTTNFLFDEIKIYKSIEESEIEDINACDTGDNIVTMQVCSLWREGTHTNWEICDNENSYDRKSLLGWYDEGTREVSDWEIKFAREHGISNFMFCWYRKGSSEVKNSKYSSAIWDGLFESKFKNDIKFSIMFENAGGCAYGYDDFMNNLMEYWIEVFFKNPNYQKTPDGKPILFVYIPDLTYISGDLNNDGKADKEDVAMLIEDMKELCVSKGLPGLYVSAECRMKSSTTIKQIENFGYDSVFSYTWSSGQYGASDDYNLAYSYDMMINQLQSIENKDEFTVLPNISKMWDTSVWMDCGFNKSSASYYYDLEHYRQFCLYVKDVYYNELSNNDMKLVMLDNWNEYSEGHWLMPTYGTPSYKDGAYGYGYLDVIKEVFGIAEYAHTDHHPLEEGYGPYDTLYPLGWDEEIDQYGTVNGIKTDNSVFEKDTVDWEIGYDTLAGKTIYLKNVTEFNGSIEFNQANRIVIYKETLKVIVDSNKDLTVKMLNGEILIKSSELKKLDLDSSLEIVLNEKLNITTEASKVRKDGRRIDDGKVFEYSIKSSGYDASIESEIKFYSEIAATEYVLLNSDTYSKLSDTIKMNSNDSIIFVK